MDEEVKTEHTANQRVVRNGIIYDVKVPLYTTNGTHHYRKHEDVVAAIDARLRVICEGCGKLPYICECRGQ